MGRRLSPTSSRRADLVTLMDKNGIGTFCISILGHLETSSCLGTDATIAQHIQTIIDRDYVIERMEGATKYLVPSTLGIGLVEGYNQIGLEKTSASPRCGARFVILLKIGFLFSNSYITTSRCLQTERRMCASVRRHSHEERQIMQGLEQYMEMFTIVRRDFQRVTSVGIHPLPSQILC